MSSVKKFKLSSSLYGHSADVRCVAIANNNSILSGSRDKTAKLWVPEQSDGPYISTTTYQNQRNFVIAVLYLEPSQEYPDGLVITGGNDKIIYVYKPSESFASIMLNEHSDAVSCLSKSSTPNCFLSGSWDSSAKFWALSNAPSSTFTLLGHSGAIWNVLELQDCRILTASADKTIGIWSKNGSKLSFLTGHNDCVRGLIDLPELHQFVSVSNDASVKLWSYSGTNVDTYYGHTNYIYSIARCKTNGENSFVTSDEDHTVRFWHNGINVDTFRLPAQSVWSVSCTSNGDIVTGSSDGVVRIFTQDERRYADEAALSKFNKEVEALLNQSSQEIGGYKISDLPGKEGLYDPGRKAGQMKMIREGNGVVAYTWIEDGENSHWEKVGDVLGSTNKSDQDKTMFEGKAYDFVFSVDVEDGKPPLKLPYNKGDDPYQVAHRFLLKNALPASYLEQIVDFILKNAQEQYVPPRNDYVDPFTGQARYTPSSESNRQGFEGANLDPFTGESSYSTSSSNSSRRNLSAPPRFEQSQKFFPVSKYRTFEMGDSAVILSKLKEFNVKFGDTKNCSVSENNLDELIKLCDGTPDDPNAFETLFSLLDWPDEVVFPVIDVVRMAVRHKKNNEIITSANDGLLIKKLMGFICDSSKVINNVVVTLRTLCNLFIHDYGEGSVYDHRFDLLESMTALGSLNKSGEVAQSTLLLNLTISSLKKKDDITISVLSDVIPDIISKLKDPESQFRAYVALGTLLVSTNSQQNEEAKAKIKSNTEFHNIFLQHLLRGSNDLEDKRRNCVQQIQDIINISC